MTGAERAEVAELFDVAAADHGLVAGALVGWPSELSDAQIDLMWRACNATFYSRPFETRNRVASCREASARILKGDDFKEHAA